MAFFWFQRKGLNIFNAPATVTLPKGTELPIILDLNVLVDKMVPVVLKVPIDIELSKTDLHEPFVGLQGVVSPYQGMLTSLPNSWEETPICNSILLNWFCSLVLIP